MAGLQAEPRHPSDTARLLGMSDVTTVSRIDVQDIKSTIPTSWSAQPSHYLVSFSHQGRLKIGFLSLG